MAFNDDFDIPIDVVLEGEFAPKALVTALPSVSLAAPVAAAPAGETRAQVLERLLTQVRERRRSRAA